MADKLWGRITSIAVGEIPPKLTGRFAPLYEDLRLRLEQTEGGMALVVPFNEDKLASAAAASLKSLFKQSHPDVIVFARRYNGGGAVFVHKQNGTEA